MSRLIDAEYLLDLIKDINDGERFGYIDAEDINNAPTVDAVPVKHGRWIGKPLAGYSTVKCSVCGSAFVENNGKWKYCPDCGAKTDVTDINVGNKEKVME